MAGLEPYHRSLCQFGKNTSLEALADLVNDEMFGVDRKVEIEEEALDQSSNELEEDHGCNTMQALFLCPHQITGIIC